MNKYTVKIKQDTDPLNPRADYDNLAVMSCTYPNYNLGDNEPDLSPEELHAILLWQDGQKEEAIQYCHYNLDEDEARQWLKEQDRIFALPLYLYDHSGISISTGRICTWDSSAIGYIYLTAARARSEMQWKLLTKGRIKKLYEYMNGEIETYDQYLTGDVHGYIIEDQNGDEVESCWGFFGSDYCEQEADRVVQYLTKRDEKSRIEKIKVMIRNHVPLCFRPDLLAAI